jgi:hypothetical protein
MPAGLDAQGQLQFAHEYLFGRWGLTLARGMGGGEYSPYRVYMNNCLTQVRSQLPHKLPHNCPTTAPQTAPQLTHN